MRDLGPSGKVGRSVSSTVDRSSDRTTRRTKRNSTTRSCGRTARCVDLGTLGGPRGDASEINERSQIVGSADIKTDRGFNISHAVLWTWKPAK